MKLFFVSIYNSMDVRNWSGIPYYLSQALLDAGIEVEFIGNLKSLPATHLKFRVRNLIYNRLFKKKLGEYRYFYERENLEFIARQVSEKINKKKGGIVFSPGTIPIAYLNTEKPIALWTDATFAVMKDYYEDFKGICKRTIKSCDSYERNALKRSSLAIYSSEWAANSSIKDYDVDPTKVKVIPFGANIEIKRTVKDIEDNNIKKSKSICKLLFVGQNWQRKGGEAAVEVARYLNEKYFKTELTIVGCTPPDGLNLPDFVDVVGFIQKTTEGGESLLNKIYSEHHFFILPTVAECTPIVFSEANSFGLPVITTNTGGISSIIKNDVNGRMFEKEMNTTSCAEYIAGIFKDYDHYKRLSLTSFNECLTNLNWQVSINKCISYMQSLEQNNPGKLLQEA